VVALFCQENLTYQVVAAAALAAQLSFGLALL
jgi:hypothetical protein